MRLSLIGVNYHTAPITLREKVAIGADKLGEALSSLRAYVPHGIIMSTCNRTEICTIDRENGQAQEACLDFMKSYAGVAEESLRKHIFLYTDREAVEHLFRVASGLESMVVGEFEVLGQIRQALEMAEKSGMVNLPLRHVFRSAVRTGRRVRNETGISSNALSVSSVAVDLAADIVGNLRKCRMLVIGAGEAGRLVAKVARERGVSQIVLASRTRQRAESLAAALHGIAIDLNDLPDELNRVNIIVTCAGAPHRILDTRRVRTAMESRARVPLVIIDIAVPRNVEPGVGRLENVFLYNIDNLTEISKSNRKQREGEILRTEEIVTDEVNKLMSWWQGLEVRPLISALMSKAEEVRTAQLNKTLKKLPPLSGEQRQSLEAMTRSIVSKILKDPVHYLRANGNEDHGEIVKKLFQLDREKRS